MEDDRPMIGLEVAHQSASPVRTRRPQRFLLPLLLLAILLAMTYKVWRLQISHLIHLQARHTEDVCVQAARRLQTFVEAQLEMAGVLAQDWARQGDSTARQARFERLAGLVLASSPSFHGLALLDRSAEPVSLVVEPDSTIEPFLDADRGALLDRAYQEGIPVLSDPYPGEQSKVSFFAVWPLEGVSMLVEYRVEELIDDCFHGQIRAEFDFSLEDDGETLFHFGPSPVSTTEMAVIHSFPVRNRQWRLTVTPRADFVQGRGLRPDLSVPVFGVALSLGIALLVYLLEVRAERFRVAEARYHGVFDSSSDGLLVLAVDSTVLDANPVACAMLGRGIPDLAGSNLSALLRSTAAGPPARLWESLDRRPTVRFEARALHREGHALDLEVSACRFLHEGQPAMLVVLSDVSELRAAARRQAQLSRQALAAQEEERGRLARDLHDDLGQLLTGLRLELDLLCRQNPDLASSLARAHELVGSSLDSVRRLCKGLRPPLLDDLGLESSIRHQVAEFESRTGCLTELEVAADEEHPPYPTELSLCAYRVLQEALTNISRHAQASRARVSLEDTGMELVLVVTDNGRGFDLSGPSLSTGLGISGMYERANLVGGQLLISSTPGTGTTVELRLALDTEPEPRRRHDASSGS
jgi:PAS domain S-box-containing protein